MFCTCDDSATSCVCTTTPEVAEAQQVQKLRTCRAGVPVLAWTPPLPLFCLRCDTSRGLPRIGPEPGLPLETFAFFTLATTQQPHAYSLPHMKFPSSSKCKKCERVEWECRFRLGPLPSLCFASAATPPAAFRGQGLDRRSRTRRSKISHMHLSDVPHLRK
jgi:hypothetical protein